MDLTQLRAFIAIAHEGNLTRAAQSLHLTQPAVSLQIKTLQSSLNVRLLLRTPSGMVLTEDGMKLLPFAERIMANVGEFHQASEALHFNRCALSGTLAIGTILDPEFTRLGAFLKSLVENYPQLSTKLQHGMSGSVLQQIRDGKLDVGYYIGTPGKEFHQQILTSFTYNVVAPHGWKNRVAGHDWRSLAQLPWIWTPAESAHNRLLTKIFTQLKVVPHKVALVDQEPSMLDLVKSGVGLSLVRESVALREAHIHGLVIADKVSLSTELSFISLAVRRDEPSIAAVLSLLKNLWGNR